MARKWSSSCKWSSWPPRILVVSPNKSSRGTYAESICHSVPMELLKQACLLHSLFAWLLAQWRGLNSLRGQQSHTVGEAGFLKHRLEGRLLTTKEHLHGTVPRLSNKLHYIQPLGYLGFTCHSSQRYSAKQTGGNYHFWAPMMDWTCNGCFMRCALFNSQIKHHLEDPWKFCRSGNEDKERLRNLPKVSCLIMWENQDLKLPIHKAP